MPTSTARAPVETSFMTVDDADSSSAVAWAAILGGSFVSLALMFVLVILGAGLNFTLTSAHGDTVDINYKGIAWLIVTQWFSAGVGAYLTGRLRTKWTGVHTHEVSFRDTAHGLMTWAVATIVYTVLILFTASATSLFNASVFDVASPAKLSLYTSLSMFIGAFIACIAAALGGLQRDEIRPLL